MLKKVEGRALTAQRFNLFSNGRGGVLEKRLKRVGPGHFWAASAGRFSGGRSGIAASRRAGRRRVTGLVKLGSG